MACNLSIFLAYAFRRGRLEYTWLPAGLSVRARRVLASTIGLLNGTTYVGEYTTRVRADHPDRANRDRQNDSEHYRILCDILAVLLPPSSAKELTHPDPNLALRKTQALEYSQTAPFRSARQWPVGAVSPAVVTRSGKLVHSGPHRPPKVNGTYRLMGSSRKWRTSFPVARGTLGWPP